MNITYQLIHKLRQSLIGLSRPSATGQARGPAARASAQASRSGPGRRPYDQRVTGAGPLQFRGKAVMGQRTASWDLAGTSAQPRRQARDRAVKQPRGAYEYGTSREMPGIALESLPRTEPGRPGAGRGNGCPGPQPLALAA